MSFTPLKLVTPKTIGVTPKMSQEVIQRVLNAAPQRATVRFAPSSYTFSKGLIVPSGVTLDATDCEIHTTLTGRADPHTLGSAATAQGGTWFTNWIDEGQRSGIWGCVWRIGRYFGTGQNAGGWTLRHMKVDTNVRWPDEAPWFGRGGNAIFVTGDCHDWLIENIITDWHTRLSNVVAVHWGCNGPADPPTATTHPSGTIRRLRVGTMTNGHVETSAVSLAAPGAVTVEDVTVESCRAGIVLYAGDYGYSKAPEMTPRLAMIRNYHAKCTWAGVLGGKPKDGSANPLRVSIHDCTFGLVGSAEGTRGDYGSMTNTAEFRNL